LTERRKINFSEIQIQESLTVYEIRAVYPVIHQLRDSIDIETFLDRVNKAQQGGYKLFYVSFENQVVGAMGLRIQDDLCWGHNLYIDDLIVDEALRNQGIGKALIKFAVDLAHSQKCEYVRLASGISRIQAHDIYEKLGYRKTSFSFALKL
jgi:ribosomal protein S18 acetylase RimI-like enzyme